MTQEIKNKMKTVENRYERKGLGDRTGEIITLSVFITVLAVCSVILVDIVVYPFSVFAINNVNLFNKIFEYTVLFGASASIVMYIRKKYRYNRKIYDTPSDAVKYMIKRPAHYISLFFITLITVSVLGVIIYLLFSENYHLLYEITGRK